MKYAVIDIETTGLNRFKDRVTWIGVGLAEEVASPLTKMFIFDTTVEEDVERFKRLCDKMREKKLRVVWQNGKFDTLLLEHHYGVRLPISDDVMLLGTAYDLAAEHGLKSMAKRYLRVPDWDITKKEKTKGTADVVVPYLKKDVQYTWELYCFFLARMNEEHSKIYSRLLLPAYKAYRKVERAGVYVDIDQLKSAREYYGKLEKERLAELNKYHKINWNSSIQVAHILFDVEKLPILAKSKKTGNPSADKAVLNRLAAKGFKLPQMIVDYKQANTLCKMFLNRWEDDLGPDGCIHSSFNLTNVVTGRTSSSSPNLQQVPRDKVVRSMFTAPPGRVFFEADYSQLELRIAADYADERTMLEIYRTGGDIHTETAKLLTGGRQPTKEERNRAKAINFGFLYGMLAKKFVAYAFDSYRSIFSLAEAERFRGLFFTKYPKLLLWHKKQEDLCEALGGVANRFGRFRKLPNIYSVNRFERLGAVRRAINTPVQGTGSDLLVASMVQLMNKHEKNGLLIHGTVHDSIIGSFPEGMEDAMVPEIKRIMSHPYIMDEFGVTFKVPLEADVGLGPWGSK